MLLSWLTETCLRGVYLLSRLFGLMAASVPQLGAGAGAGAGAGGQAGRRVYYSRYWRLHSYVIFILVLAYFPCAFHEIVSSMMFLRQNWLVFIVGCIRYFLLMVSTLGTHYQHTRHQQCLIAWINRVLRCRRQLLRLLHESSARRSALQLRTRAHLLTVFALILSVLCSSSHTIFILSEDYMAMASANYFCSVLFFYLSQLSLQLCLALYLLALLFLGHLWQHSNGQLERLLADALQVQQKLQGHRPPRTALLAAQQRWIALELWRHARLHVEMLQLGRQLCSLHHLQLLAFVIYVPIECVVHAFFTYFVMYSRWWLREMGHSMGINYYGVMFVCGLFVQMSLVILYTHRQRQMLTATRHTLRAGALALPHGCTKQLRQTVSCAIVYR